MPNTVQPIQQSPSPFLGLQRVDGYVLRQLLGMLGLTLSLITMVVFFSDTVFDLIKEMQALGLPLVLSVYLVLLQLPNTLAFALLPALTLSVFAVYSQLNQQFEIVALRMQGLSLWRLARPVMVVACSAAVVAFVLFETVLPWCAQQTELLRQDWGSLSKLTLKRDGMVLPIYHGEQLDSLIYATQANGRQVRGLSYIDTHQPERITLLQANRGQRQKDGAWHLQQVTLLSWNQATQEFVSNHMESLRRKELLGRIRPESTENEDASLPPLEVLSFLEGQRQLSSQATLLAHNARSAESAESGASTAVSLPAKSYMKLWDRLFQPSVLIVMALLSMLFALDAPRSQKRTGLWYWLASVFSVYMIKSFVVLWVVSTVSQWGLYAQVFPCVGVALGSVVCLLVLSCVFLIRRKEQSL
jgi:lipopolysaccharide export LptBFGC system permease protein LptF